VVCFGQAANGARGALRSRVSHGRSGIAAVDPCRRCGLLRADRFALPPLVKAYCYLSQAIASEAAPRLSPEAKRGLGGGLGFGSRFADLLGFQPLRIRWLFVTLRSGVSCGSGRYSVVAVDHRQEEYTRVT